MDQGLKRRAASPHVGLGTSIVEALAHQLNATVEKTSGPQGTTVTTKICRENYFVERNYLMTYVDSDYDSHPLYASPNLGTWTMVIGWILISFGLAYYWAHIS
jgi:hypothetical protein